MAKKVRVNVRSTVNNDGIRRETRHGREKIIVPSATMPDDVVMNGIMYPADEIATSFESLNGTPAPLGHPTLDGKFLSAHTTEAQIRNGIGAENENARRENGRVFVDKVIDVEFAGRTEGGKAVLAAIDAGDPIHTSTGLLCELENVAAGQGYKYVARSIYFDHDAILLDQEGAATPDQGVGMMVNAKGEEFEVINSRVDWAEDDLAWAAEHLLDSAERLEKAKQREALLPRLVEALRSIMSGGSAETTSTVQKEEPMDEQTKEALDAVNAKVDAISESISTTIADAVGEAVKPLVEAQNAAAEREAAKEKAERDEVVNKLVEAEVFADADEAKDIPVAALNKMLGKFEKPEPKKAAALRPGMPATNNGKRNFKAPAAEEAN